MIQKLLPVPATLLATLLATALALPVVLPVAVAVEYQSPRTLSLGGSGRAAPLLTDAIYLNPAYSSFVTSYSLGGSYLWFDGGRNYNFSIQDSRTEMFQAGAGFSRREQGAAVNIGASKAVIDRLGFGLGMKILIDDLTGKTFIGTLFSTSFLALDEFNASLIIDNLTENKDSRQRNAYRDIFIAMKGQPIKELQLYFDPFYSPSYVGGNKSGFTAGAEFALMADFYLRIGKMVDSEVVYLNTRGDGFGLGVGWIGPKVTFEYGYHRMTAAHNGLGIQTAHSTGMTIFF
jgi:hypothetical protein